MACNKFHKCLLYNFVTIVSFVVMLLSKTKAISLPMIPIDSPHLKMYPHDMSPQHRHELLMNITISRTSSLQLYSSNSTINSIFGDVHWKPSNFYVTQIFLGTSTPILSTFLLLDTGAINTWAQCEGCNPCFEIKQGSLQVFKSPSYSYMSLGHSMCNPRIPYNERFCGYKAVYGAEATSIGIVGTDDFIFQNDETHAGEIFRDVAFGCGMMNTNINFGLNKGPNNMIAGIFGLAPGPLSLLNQLDATIKGRFSYCLTSWADTGDRLSTIHFGDSAQIGGGPDVSVIRMNARGHYHLTFRGISVEGFRLPIDPSKCALDTTSTSIKGFIIDSGAPHSVLDSSIYKPLRAHLVAFFAKYGWRQVKDQFYDLCYVIPGGPSGQRFPDVIFHFENGESGGSEVNWVMQKNNMFVNFDKVPGFCLVIKEAGDSGFCILGAYQHANFRVLYDVKGSKLSFKPETCLGN